MPDLTVVELPLDELLAYHRNPRRGDVDAIAASLTARGQYRPIVVNIGTLTGRPYEVLAGNHTAAAARSLGWPTIQATTVDVDDEGAAQIVLADNRLADLGTYDDAALLDALVAAGDLAGTGYEPTDLAALAAALDEPVALTDPDDVPDKPAEPISEDGDIWELGPHRLIVGSCANVELIRSAGLGDVDAVWTDPPYGVSYVGKTSDALTIDNDGADEAADVFAAALRTILELARPGAPYYVACPPGPDVLAFAGALGDAGMPVRQPLVWVKQALVLGRSDYHYRHEFVLEGTMPIDEPDTFETVAYGFTPGAKGRNGRGSPGWYGDNKQTTVFEVPRPMASRIHPTMKPVELIVRMLRNSLRPGGLVFDPFAGSGSTLIAAHQLGSRALLVELDPHYADVICRRYQEHTGTLPVRRSVAHDLVGEV